MMTVDEVLKISDVSCAIGSYPNVLAAEVRRLRDEVNGLTGSLDRAEAIIRSAKCGSVDSFLALPDSMKRIWFADSVEESSRRKAAEESLQNLMSFLSVNGCWAYLPADEAEKRIRDGIDMLVRPVLARAEAAEAALKEAHEQQPIKYLYRVTDCFGHDVLRDDPKGATILETIPLYAAPVPANQPLCGVLAVPANLVDTLAGIALKCTDCYTTDAIDALLQSSQAALAVPEEWREKLIAEFPLFNDEGLCQEKHHCEWALQQDRKRLHALLQSTGEKK